MSKYMTKGEASLEMVVGLIILLVVAGVVIGLVMTTMSEENITGVAKGDAADTFVTQCDNYCNVEDATSYCTSKFEDEFWDKDEIKGELVNAEEWDFCEDGAYCFLVTDCDAFNGKGDVEYCRKYLCQMYKEKYGSTTDASQKLSELFKASEDTEGCCRKDKDGNTECYSELDSRDQWTVKFFNNNQYCGGTGGGTTTSIVVDGVCNIYSGENRDNCDDCICGDGVCDSAESSAGDCSVDCTGGSQNNTEAELYVKNCTYDGIDTITCASNCEDVGLMTVSHGDNAATCLSTEVLDIGTITISGGNVSCETVHTELDGDIYYNLSELSGDYSTWSLTLVCDSPDATKVLLPGSIKASN